MRLDWLSLVEVLKNAERVVLTSHVRPDCDALGSELGMLGILEALGKHVRIVNAQATPPTLAWIDPHKRIESLAEGVKKADLLDRDLVIVLDTSAWAQLGAMADVVKELRSRVVVIDHHVSEDDLSDRWFKDSTAEATARIVAEVGLRLKVPLTEAIATPLYAGLSTDTGGFRFPSTSGETFRVGTELAVILIEQSDGRVKTSFRSRGSVDCSALAGRFGGGGHKAAAGSILPGPFDEALALVSAAVDEAWLQSGAAPA